MNPKPSIPRRSWEQEMDPGAANEHTPGPAHGFPIRLFMMICATWTVLSFLWLHAAAYAAPKLPGSISEICGVQGQRVWVKDRRRATFVSGPPANLNATVEFATELLKLGEDENGLSVVILHGWFDNFFHHPRVQGKQALSINHMGGYLSPTPGYAKFPKNTRIEGAGELPYQRQQGRYVEVCLQGVIPSESLTDNYSHIDSPTFSGRCHPNAPPLWMISRKQNRLDSKTGAPIATIEFGTRLLSLDPVPQNGRIHVALTGWIDDLLGPEQIDARTIKTKLPTQLASEAELFSPRIATLSSDSRCPIIGKQFRDNDNATYQLCIEGFVQAQSVTSDAARAAELAEQYADHLLEKKIARFAPVAGTLSGSGMAPRTFTRILYKERDSYENLIGPGIVTGTISIVPQIFLIQKEELLSRALPLVREDGTRVSIPFGEISRIRLSRCASPENESIPCGQIILKNGKRMEGMIRDRTTGNRVSHLSFVQTGEEIHTLKLPCDCTLTFSSR